MEKVASKRYEKDMTVQHIILFACFCCHVSLLRKQEGRTSVAEQQTSKLIGVGGGDPNFLKYFTKFEVTKWEAGKRRQSSSREKKQVKSTNYKNLEHKRMREKGMAAEGKPKNRF